MLQFPPPVSPQSSAGTPLEPGGNAEASGSCVSLSAGSCDKLVQRLHPCESQDSWPGGVKSSRVGCEIDGVQTDTAVASEDHWNKQLWISFKVTFPYPIVRLGRRSMNLCNSQDFAGGLSNLFWRLKRRINIDYLLAIKQVLLSSSVWWFSLPHRIHVCYIW